MKKKIYFHVSIVEFGVVVRTYHAIVYTFEYQHTTLDTYKKKQLTDDNYNLRCTEKNQGNVTMLLLHIIENSATNL